MSFWRENQILQVKKKSKKKSKKKIIIKKKKKNTGWLERRGTVIKSWKKRYVKLFLDQRILSYHVNSFRNNEALGVVRFSEITSLEGKLNYEGKNNVIVLYTVDKLHLLSCSDELQFTNWLNNLLMAISQNNISIKLDESPQEINSPKEIEKSDN